MNDGLLGDIEYLKERFEKSPDSRLFAPLADAYRKNGQLDEAIAILEEGIGKYPDYAIAHVILGKCYFDKGATERAKVEFEKVLELDPENMVALKMLGDILSAEGKKKEALEYYRKLISIDPTNKEVSKIISEMEGEFEAKELSLEDTEKIRDQRPKELATMTLAGIYAAQGYYNKALKIYREILSREPDNKEAQNMVDKLETLVESSEGERTKAFKDEDVLTISLEDVSEGITEVTAGHGGEDFGEKEEEEVGEETIEGGGTEKEGLEGEDGVRTEEEILEVKEEKASEVEGKSSGEVKKEDIELFRQWIKKLKGSSEEESEDT